MIFVDNNTGISVFSMNDTAMSWYQNAVSQKMIQILCNWVIIRNSISINRISIKSAEVPWNPCDTSFSSNLLHNKFVTSHNRTNNLIITSLSTLSIFCHNNRATIQYSVLWPCWLPVVRCCGILVASTWHKLWKKHIMEDTEHDFTHYSTWFPPTTLFIHAWLKAHWLKVTKIFAPSKCKGWPFKTLFSDSSGSHTIFLSHQIIRNMVWPVLLTSLT